MRFTSYINWLNENEKGDITILFPGSFKPLHMGHVSLILRYLNHPNVKEVRVLIGPGIRNGITENEAFEIATLLLKGLNNVIIETVTYPSPILTAYKYIETAKPGIYTMAGVEKDKGPRGYQRVLDFVKSYNEGGKYYHLKPKGVSVIELPIDIKPVLYKGRTDEYEGKPISASILRQDILNDDYNNFRTNYLGCDEETIKKIWKTTQMVITESSSNVDFDVSDDNLLPDRVIDAFCNRIKRIINDHGNKDNLQIKQELNRIKYLNGRKIPKKINDLLKESKLFEGGNAIPESRDLTKEELLKTFEYVEKVTTKLLNISKEDLFPVGSFAKKPETETYGDIDVLLNIKSLGIDENEVLDYVYDKFNSSGYTAVKSKGFNQVSVGFPIEGYKNKGIAQVDFMLASSMQWSKFAYHVSPSSKYKAAYAHFLMSAIITESFKKTEKLDKNGEVEEYSFVSFRLPSGLFKVTKTHKGKIGRVKTAKITKEEFISNDPKDAIYYTFGKDYPVDDMRSFEKIWELMHRRDFIHKDKLPVILDKFRHYLTNNSMSFPKEAINKYPEIFKINESLNEKFTEDSDPIKDMGIGMEEKINKFINSKLADAAAADDIWYKLFICIEWRQVEYVKYLLEKYRYAKDKIEGFIIHNQMKKHPNQKIDKMLNNYYESLNEKFTEDSDPIRDLGIGCLYRINLYTHENSDTFKRFLKRNGIIMKPIYKKGHKIDDDHYYFIGTKNSLEKLIKKYYDFLMPIEDCYTFKKLNEGDISIRRLNTHMQHIEELLFEGNEGLKFINYIISNLFNKLTNKPSEVIVSTKIDGSPTMMLWSKFPGLKDYGVGTKTVFNKQPVTSHTDEDVDKNFGDRPDLAEKLKTLLKYAKQIQIPEGEIWQGDFLFSSDILKKEGNIISFKPNTIRYSVDIDSDLGQKIMNSEFGIIWHTRYIGEDISSVRTVYSINLENISHPDGIYMSEPYLNQIDVDKLKDFIKDNKNLKNKISSVSQKLSDLNSEKYNEFLEYKTFQVLFLKFYNKIIRTKDTLDSKTFAKDFIEFIKSEKSENIVLKIKEFISKYSDIINLIIDLMKDITQIKRDLLVRLNKLQTYSASVELKSGGYKNVNQEGFAISSPSGDVVKLVDREEFSYANFSPEIVKGWVKK